MSKKIDDGPAVTRSTFIDANSGQATPEPVASEELKATIAETRAALNAELREENVSLRSELTNMTEKYASISHVISSANTRAFDAEAEAVELREQLSQLRADTDGNDIEADVAEPSAEEAAERDFFALVRQHLHLHGMGPRPFSEPSRASGASSGPRTSRAWTASPTRCSSTPTTCETSHSAAALPSTS